MDPNSIISILSSYSGINEVSICELEELCSYPFRQCKQVSLVLNFDDVKECYTKKKKIESPSSVDALGKNSLNSVLCFIEIKSWNSFVSHNRLSSENIELKVESYNLQKKFKDSCEICQNILNLSDALLSEVKIAFLLVSDVDNSSSDISYEIASSLNSLAISSSDWLFIYNKQINKAISKIKGCSTYYLSCKELDKYLKTID